jgi:hypothetical protein
MKEQYFGDIKDFYKFFFLKNIIHEYKLGINWCLTSKDKSNEGNDKVINYPELENEDKNLYKILAEGKFSNIEIKYFNHNTKYYTEEHKEFHKEYIYEKAAFSELKNQDVIFFDPDNGIEMPSKSLSERYKYISYRTISKYWNINRTLIIFQYKDHQKYSLKTKKENLCSCLGCKSSDILIINSKYVYYICIINKQHEKIKKYIHAFCNEYLKLGFEIVNI